jgi:DNA-binding transcriptional ArsR family regulator
MSKRSIVENDLCEINCVDERKVRSISKKLGNAAEHIHLAELFKALGNPTRVKILRALTVSELCVCDIAAVVGLSMSAVSHQLRFLRMSRLVKFRRDGKMAYYSLDDDHVRSLIEQGLEHAGEDR